MLTSLSIKSFRGFTELKLEPLDRVNLIAGKNNTGKTAVLEAIYLRCNPTNATKAIDMARLRGVQDPRIEDVAEWLFFSAKTDGVAEVSTHETSGVMQTSTLRIADARDASDPDFPRVREFLNQLNPNFLPWDTRTLLMKYSDTSGLDLLGIAMEPREGDPFRTSPSVFDNRAPSVPVVYVNSRDQIANGGEERTAQGPAENILFNQIDAEGRQDEILAPLRLLEPRLERLSFNLFNGKTVIHGELDGVPRKVPLPLMGEGVRRVLLILSAMANAKDGVVLVDEVENGLHYSVLPDLWRAIGEAARRLEVQVFATTHSWECIRAAHQAFSADGAYDLRLHRLDRTDRQIHAVTYGQRTLGTSVEMAMEVR